MSDTADVPRLLATLLGIDVPVGSPSSGPGARAAGAAAVPPPAPAASAAAEARAGSARRPPALEERQPVARPDRVARPVVAVERSVARANGDAVRRAVARPASLRTAVVTAELLGAPRALRPYGAPGPL